MKTTADISKDPQVHSHFPAVKHWKEPICRQNINIYILDTKMCYIYIVKVEVSSTEKVVGGEKDSFACVLFRAILCSMLKKDVR